MSNTQDSIIPKVVIVGHVDHGKSSMIGRLMYDLNEVPEQKYSELKAVSEKREGKVMLVSRKKGVCVESMKNSWSERINIQK